MVQFVPFLLVAGIVATGIWASVRPRTPRAGAPQIICPNGNCNYTGEPQKESRGSMFAGLFLCCFFLLPGIVYFIVKGGYRYLCPKCGMQIRSDN